MIIECILLSMTLCRAIRDRPVMAMVAVRTATILADGAISAGQREDDPISRVFIGHRPVWKRMVPAGAAQIVLETYIAERMRRSRHPVLRKVWYIAPAIGEAGNGVGIIYSLRH